MTLKAALVALVLAPELSAASRHGRHHAGQSLRSHRHIHRHGHHGHDHRSHDSVSQEDRALFAKKLAAVEDDWRSQVVLAQGCNDGQVDASKCESLPQSFRESCAAVSGKFVQVNGGNTGQIRHFMELVCGDAAMNDPSRRSQCSSMAGGIVDAKEKSDRDHGSLESVLGAMCDGMWARMVQSEAQSARELAEAPAQAAAEDHVSNQIRAAGQQAVSADAVAPAAVQGQPSTPSRPKLAAVATHTSVGKAVLVVSDGGSRHDEDQEDGDSDGAAAGKEAGDSEDEEGDEDDGQKDGSTADDSQQRDTKDGNKDGGAGGDEDGGEEGDDSAD